MIRSVRVLHHPSKPPEKQYEVQHEVFLRGTIVQAEGWKWTWVGDYGSMDKAILRAETIPVHKNPEVVWQDGKRMAKRGR